MHSHGSTGSSSWEQVHTSQHPRARNVATQDRILVSTILLLLGCCAESKNAISVRQTIEETSCDHELGRNVANWWTLFTMTHGPKLLQTFFYDCHIMIIMKREQTHVSYLNQTWSLLWKFLQSPAAMQAPTDARRIHLKRFSGLAHMHWVPQWFSWCRWGKQSWQAEVHFIGLVGLEPLQ